MAKFYAVRKGRTTGIFQAWDECKASVNGFPGAEYKSFPTEEAANEYLGNPAQLTESSNLSLSKDTFQEDISETYAFVDGSFNPDTNVYGYGGFLCHEGKKYLILGSGVDEEMATMRNVAGEISGTWDAICKAEELGVKSLTIYYDYAGIEAWATGAWKAKKQGTKKYADFIKQCDVQISFEKVAAHTGIIGNECADVLAKHAVGIGLTAKQQLLLEDAYAMCEPEAEHLAELEESERD